MRIEPLQIGLFQILPHRPSCMLVLANNMHATVSLNNLYALAVNKNVNEVLRVFKSQQQPRSHQAVKCQLSVASSSAVL